MPGPVIVVHVMGRIFVMRSDVEIASGAETGDEQVGAQLLLTVGHGTLGRNALAAALGAGGVRLVVDVRSAPGTRRYPQFGRAEMERRLPAAGIDYRWKRDLGGYRRPLAQSENLALDHLAFRRYADYIATRSFALGLRRLLDDAAARPTAALCAETLWWRCHHRLIADAAVLLAGATVVHLGHDGRLAPHRVTEGARLVESGGMTTVVYDARAAA